MLRMKYSIDKAQVEQMSLTISVTMTVEEWLNIMRTKPETIEPHSPFWKLQNMISSVMNDVSNATEKKYSLDQWLSKQVEE